MKITDRYLNKVNQNNNRNFTKSKTYPPSLSIENNRFIKQQKQKKENLKNVKKAQKVQEQRKKRQIQEKELNDLLREVDELLKQTSVSIEEQKKRTTSQEKRSQKQVKDLNDLLKEMDELIKTN